MRKNLQRQLQLPYSWLRVHRKRFCARLRSSRCKGNTIKCSNRPNRWSLRTTSLAAAKLYLSTRQPRYIAEPARSIWQVVWVTRQPEITNAARCKQLAALVSLHSNNRQCRQAKISTQSRPSEPSRPTKSITIETVTSKPKEASSKRLRGVGVNALEQQAKAKIRYPKGQRDVRTPLQIIKTIARVKKQVGRPTQWSCFQATFRVKWVGPIAATVSAGEVARQTHLWP